MLRKTHIGRYIISIVLLAMIIQVSFISYVSAEGSTGPVLKPVKPWFTLHKDGYSHSQRTFINNGASGDINFTAVLSDSGKRRTASATAYVESGETYVLNLKTYYKVSRRIHPGGFTTITNITIGVLSEYLSSNVSFAVTGDVSFYEPYIELTIIKVKSSSSSDTETAGDTGSAPPDTETATSGSTGRSVTDGASNWAVPEIQKAVEYKLADLGILSNYQDRITRDEFSRCAVNLYEALSGKTAQPVNNPFNDTDSETAVKAYGLGIINGVGGGRFAPDDPIIRQDLCVMILRAVQAVHPEKYFKASDKAEGFSDAELISDYAKNAVGLCSAWEVVKGSNGNMNPKGNVTRQEAIAMIVRTYLVFNEE